jgi:hypothetical protein
MAKEPINASFNTAVITAMSTVLDALVKANEAGPKLAVDLRNEIDTIIRSGADEPDINQIILSAIQAGRESCTMLDHVVPLDAVTPIIDESVTEAMDLIKNDIATSDLTKPPPVIETPTAADMRAAGRRLQ